MMLKYWYATDAMQRKVRVDQPVYSVNDCLLASDINSVLQSTLIQPGVMLQKAL